MVANTLKIDKKHVYRLVFFPGDNVKAQLRLSRREVADDVSKPILVTSLNSIDVRNL